MTINFERAIKEEIITNYEMYFQLVVGSFHTIHHLCQVNEFYRSLECLFTIPNCYPLHLLKRHLLT